MATLLRMAAALALAASVARPASAQVPTPAPQPQTRTWVAEVIASARPDLPATMKLANRDIVVLRASVLGRSSADRASAAARLLREIALAGGPARATMTPVDEAMAFSVDGRSVLAVVPADVDTLAGETMETKSAAALARMQQALDEMRELETPHALLWGAVKAAGATVIFAGLLWLLGRLDRAAGRRLAAAARRHRAATPAVAAALLHQARLVRYAKRAIDLATLVLGLLFAYLWLLYVLRRFPYSRPWSDALRGFLLDRLAWLGLGIADAIPDLVTVALIVMVTRVLARLVQVFFVAVEEGRITLSWLYPETAAPTRKIATGALWLFALVIAYPYLPGSGTDAFKGVSVFLGLIVSLGSTGIVNQLMSGLTITYSRAVRAGDYVRVGELEGTVAHLGTLSMKIDTPWSEQVTIPNSVLISREITNYSRSTSETTVFATTTVSIGYDAPWRQVQSLLVLAAERTPGVRRDPAPIAMQVGLDDFYVKYVLAVGLEDPRARVPTLAALYANIQDAFNEAGVQIMSPHYLGDPQAKKVVPKDRWSPPGL
ncbi:MAG TPA: mechanosensitive ion channel domain-containing protein [Vicinamibacterales bacterium]|nr:mechanosensitive ion channel domain-containing protein [Vicinamibacterales bacterium]